MWHEASRCRGITLVELLMCIAIIAILLPLAMPSFATITGRTRSQNARIDLGNALNMARISAVSHGTHAVTCPSDDQQQCSHTTQWHHGWIVFTDLNHDEARSADEPILTAAGPQSAGVAILSTVGRLRVDYQPDGTADGTNLTLTVCDRAAGAANASTLVISQSGRIRHGVPTPDATAACLHVAG